MTPTVSLQKMHFIRESECLAKLFFLATYTSLKYHPQSLSNFQMSPKIRHWSLLQVMIPKKTYMTDLWKVL